MNVTDKNVHAEKIHNLTLYAQKHSDMRWASAFVHRGQNYCKPYTSISKASMQRVLRAQERMVLDGTT